MIRVSSTVSWNLSASALKPGAVNAISKGAATAPSALTTVRIPASEMGEAAAEAILKQLAGQSHKLPTLSADLVVRESVARFR